MMKKLFGFFLLFVSISISCPAQVSREVFAPFASRIRVSAENGSVKVTWEDSDDVEGSYIIYRHTKEITNDTFSGAVRVGESEENVESFIDYPDETGTYFYAVLIRDRNGKIYDLFIPFRNKTTKGIAVNYLGTENELAARITNIDTQIQRDSILVTFNSSKEDRELIIYRSTTPITKSTDLAYSQLLRAIPSSRSSFQDFPVPGISYYYAIMDSGLVKIGEISFNAGENATIIPASIPVGNRIGLPETTISRNLPLPLLPLSLEIDSGEQLSTPRTGALPVPKSLDPATNKAVSSLMTKLKGEKDPEMKSVVLQEDKGPIVSGGEEYTLKSILNKEFAEKRWLESERLLKNFLSVHRSEEIEQRGRFYLGQTLYFQKKYRESFMQFILIRDNLYTQVSPWIDRLFTILIEV